MTIKEQLNKLKENWLLILLVIILLGAMLLIQPANIPRLNLSSYAGNDGIAAESGINYKMAASSYSYYPQPATDNFAPGEQNRKITKAAYMSSEVKQGTFKDAETKLKAIITTANAYLLNENVNTENQNEYSLLYGNYQIKVESSKCDAIITQLKEIGKVISFNQIITDITGQTKSIEIELAVEKERLTKFQDLYNNAKTTQEKLDITDRIFNQERTIKYYEDALKNKDQQVQYSTIDVTITEKQSEYQNVIFIKFSELIQKLVLSINELLSLLFILLPYAIVIGLVYLIIKMIQKKQ